uniref:NADH-ubiquinone oxidoreductase chain 2 n=1 Tax=Pachyphlegyas modiglianii TaxID=2816051 RepID=A0A8T9ZXF5_9HEMI|nr:NADH dehydrogenase subunit 2 [Pachyphlegyas modiglianii]
MNFSILLYLLGLIMGTLLTISSNNWLSMWMGLELNLMSFIPLMSTSKNTKSSQAMIIYFITQGIGSVFILFSITLMKFSTQSIFIELIKLMMVSSLLLKMGASPFHFWLPEMMSKLNWIKCMILITWQKLAPLSILNNINNNFIYISILLSTFIGSMGGLNQTSLRKIMAYSSINHTSWLMTYMMISSLWYNYWLIYTIIIVMLLWIFNSFNSYHINQLYIFNMTILEKYALSVLLLSVGGMPPFMGFLPKLMVINDMINTKMFPLLLFMMLMSLITMFYYLRMIYSIIMINYMSNKWNLFIYNKKMLKLIIMVNLLLPLMYLIL